MTNTPDILPCFYRVRWSQPKLRFTPIRVTSLQGIEGVQGATCTGSGRFKHSEPRRTCVASSPLLLNAAATTPNRALALCDKEPFVLKCFKGDMRNTSEMT